MADPAVISCPVNTWTKVATNVSQGYVWKKQHQQLVWVWTQKDTGNPAPTDLTKAVYFTGECAKIDSSVGIDVYMYPISKATITGNPSVIVIL